MNIKLTAILATVLISILYVFILWFDGHRLLTSVSDTETVQEASFQSSIDAYIKTQMQEQNIPGLALGIVNGDQVVYVNGYGRADSSGREVTSETPFVIGSNSKSITATAVLQLVEAGKIDLDAPVQHYIPSFHVKMTEDSYQDVITVRHLLNQTSGLPPYTPNGETSEDQGNTTLKKAALTYSNGMGLARPVGEYGYANANYVLLGYIVEKASGQPYEDYVKEHIFETLAMHKSFLSQDEALRNGLASPHRRWFGFTVEYTGEDVFQAGDLPAGFIISSAENMSHYLIAQMNGGRFRDASVLSSKSVRLMQTEPISNTYGMGWLFDEINGVAVIGHAGGTPGFQSHIWFSPEQRIGVIVLANVVSVLDALPDTEYSMATDIASDVMNIMTEQPLTDYRLSINQRYWLLNGAVVLLSGWLALALIRTGQRYLRLAQQRTSKRYEWVWRLALVFILHFIWPCLIVIMTYTSVIPIWQVLTVFQPDVVLWLKLMAIIVLLKGLVETGLLTQKWKTRKKRQIRA
ncbi:serine hydrolase [Gracilibacillus salitolerans]|uniref:Serine hydrolase n=1 Tax=Gracilibacillus salitolerans TaxID=2663022 RepID=A0A5Q2TPU9_9BACI|nr:serine hydrolase domain-containing protein [Gracilibacillus salitolerans]QGH36147.1 serine hydrolase [Gracilibacillus salitolerans]